MHTHIGNNWRTNKGSISINNEQVRKFSKELRKYRKFRRTGELFEEMFGKHRISLETIPFSNLANYICVC